MPRNPRGPSPGGPAQNVIHTKWDESRQFLPAQAPVYRGFFKLETLENAVERQLLGRDPLILPSVRKMLGDTPLSHLIFDLVWEGANRLLFVVVATNKRGARAQLGWVVARNHQEYGVAVTAGYAGLKALHTAAPGLAVTPLQNGFVYLPDRHKRVELGRETPSYFFVWPYRAVPLVTLQEDQLGLSAQPAPKLLRRADTEQIRATVTGLLLRAYRTDAGSGLNLSALTPEDFLGWRAEAGHPAGAAVMFSRAKEVRQTPGRYLLRVLQAAWPAPSGLFRLAPSDAEVLAELIRKSAGAGNAQIWALEALEMLKRRPGGGSDAQNAVGVSEACREALREVAGG